ncbi:hypothetical protein MYX77_10810 [Acidobacteriia bacterium AH_259_A11_L15]|nr:hypothetical protein [Acidobacteriia bacterium AH_259_A11_L15]
MERYSMTDLSNITVKVRCVGTSGKATTKGLECILGIRATPVNNSSQSPVVPYLLNSCEAFGKVAIMNPRKIYAHSLVDVFRQRSLGIIETAQCPIDCEQIVVHHCESSNRSATFHLGHFSEVKEFSYRASHNHAPSLPVVSPLLQVYGFSGEGGTPVNSTPQKGSVSKGSYSWAA